MVECAARVPAKPLKAEIAANGECRIANDIGAVTAPANRVQVPADEFRLFCNSIEWA